MKPRQDPLSKRLGSALVMTLVIIVLITVVTVGYLASVMLETKTAGSSLDQERAYGIAMVGAHEAMARVREALGPWDDPYREFATNATNFYWSLSPGRITRWDYRTTNSTNFGLFSEPTGTTTNFVNLNRQLADGSYPIIGGSNAPELSVQWANLLLDPSQPASVDNPIVGRYAFWVDDEGAKVNVNTADGTEKYTTNSLGIGTPSEVSLEWVLGGTNAKDVTKEVVRMARTNGFSSPREILRVPGVATNAFAENVFSLTAYSRSPELNVFGQPRVAVAPLLGSHGFNSSDMVLNSLTFLPPREIYPTPSQLPGFTFLSRYDIDNQTRTNPWPLSLRGELGVFSTGKEKERDMRDVLKYGPNNAPNYSYNQGFLLAKYLSGTNGAGQPVTWPVFRGPTSPTSTNGFAGKYSPRQLDSIVAQILSIGSKGISSDYPYISGDDEQRGEKMGHRFMVVPYLFPGWLSGRWVTGIGRSPKVTQLRMKVEAFHSTGIWDPANTTNYTPPEAIFDIWLEWWLPAGYFGGPKKLPFELSRYFVGHRGAKSVLNVIDYPRNPGDPTVANRFAAPLPRIPDADSPEIYAFWANQLLRNNQGIDLAGNPSNTNDHDQWLAETNHDPFARSDPAVQGQYLGTAKTPNNLDAGQYFHYASPLVVTEIERNPSPTQEWQPGEMRSLRSLLGDSYRMPMRTNADNSVLQVRGGIAVKTQMKDGHLTDPDPVPLEAARGAYIVDGITTQEPFQQAQDEATMNNNWAATTLVMPNGNTIEAFPGDASKKFRDRVLASVIPVSIDVTVDGSVGTFTAIVRDPLVNKFPGDWEATNSPAPIQPPDRLTPQNVAIYDDAAFRATLADPDSYWMPQADAGLCNSIANVAVQTLIPRSARMPNIGYLQYVRTGIIPDDEENVPYSAQHGTPFRLLSFAPSYEPQNLANPLVGQQTTNSASQPYPDWALLDLFYIPSTLAPYGSTYHPPVANPTTNAVETKLLYYGTYGGATAGKINPNGAVIYTTDADVAEPNISRTFPLEAVFDGVIVNQSVTGSGTNVGFSGGTSVSATNIAAAIESFLRTNGPFRIPAEICNVPDIANLRATNNPTRNDLVRQVVGALTTQGNVFSVWTVGQAVKKKPTNGQFGEFETGDNVLAEVRLHFIVERYLDPGADNIYGNSTSAGLDAVIGTYDDPVDPASHPSQPRYLYRVLASEEIR